MADLATVADLNNFSQLALDPADTSAAFLLSVASGMIRRYLEQDITVTTNDVEYADPVGPVVLLRQLPVTSVSLVETTTDGGVTWTTVAPANYTVSKRQGVVAARPWTGIQWGADPESWRITYTHGYATVPDEINGVCCSIAARFYSTPAGIDMERTGQRQVKYSLESAGFSGMEAMVLSAFRNPRVA
ncbi:MAG: hypothetical protein M3O29_03970 [Actinomycetota bacterium]|nr:hypothetical protein [Actinomycetota bacterium]